MFFLPPPTATSPENCSPTNFCKLASNSPPVGPLTLVVTAPFSAMDIFTLYSILPVDCGFLRSRSVENDTGGPAGGGFAIALATGPCVTGRGGPVDTGDVGSGGGGGFLPELFEFVFNNLAFSSARVSIPFLCCFLIVSLFCCGDGGGGGEFVPELFELIFKKGLVSCSVDDFGGGCGCGCGSTLEGFLSREP